GSPLAAVAVDEAPGLFVQPALPLALVPGAAESGAVGVGGAFPVRARLALADLAKIDDLGHRMRGYFLRKASRETTSAPLPAAGCAASSGFSFSAGCFFFGSGFFSGASATGSAAGSASVSVRTSNSSSKLTDGS